MFLKPLCYSHDKFKMMQQLNLNRLLLPWRLHHGDNWISRSSSILRLSVKKHFFFCGAQVRWPAPKSRCASRSSSSTRRRPWHSEASTKEDPQTTPPTGIGESQLVIAFSLFWSLIFIDSFMFLKHRCQKKIYAKKIKMYKINLSDEVSILCPSFVFLSAFFGRRVSSHISLGY